MPGKGTLICSRARRESYSAATLAPARRVEICVVPICSEPCLEWSKLPLEQVSSGSLQFYSKFGGHYDKKNEWKESVVCQSGALTMWMASLRSTFLEYQVRTSANDK